MPLVEAFYEAAILPELWVNALNQASQAWGADGVSLVSYPDCVGGIIASQGAAELSARYVAEGWYKRDARAARAMPILRHEKDLVTDLDLFTQEELGSLPYYSDFLATSGFRWFAGSTLTESGGAMVALSIDRRATREPFSAEEIARIRQDLPHLRRAARLATKGRVTYAEGLLKGFEHFNCGSILIDRMGRVIHMNGRAEALLGADLQVVAARLRSPHRESNKALQDFIAAGIRPVVSSADPPPPSMVLVHRSQGAPLVISSYPVVRQASDVFQGARMLLLISDPDKPRVLARSVLQEVFRATPTELRVAAALLEGLDTQEIATKHGVGAQTVRYHLKSLFAKTGTNHQAELVSLLTRFTEPL